MFYADVSRLFIWQAYMQAVSDIMIKNIVTCPIDGSLLTGHRLMREKEIRHLPIVNAAGQLEGILSQKEVLKEVLTIVNDRGAHRLEYYEDRIPVKAIMSPANSVLPDISIAEAGEYFLKHKAGCLTITDTDNKLVGIVSSHDFVKLSIRLLKH